MNRSPRPAPHQPSRQPSLSTLAVLALAAIAIALSVGGCDEPQETPPPAPDATVPTNCFADGCPPGEFCQSNGRCATADQMAAGVQACTALSSCLGQCPDQLCIEQCLLESSDEGYRRYVDIVDCLDIGGCFTEQGVDEDCMFDACAPEYVGCFGELPPRPQGRAPCGAFVRCINDCPVEPAEDEEACIDACVTDASPAAFERYVAAVDCVQRECAGEPPTCQEERCGDILDACFDHGLGTGVLTCDEVLECVFSCPDSDCYARCEQDASAEGLSLWRDFVDCAVSTGCGSIDRCLVTCPTETRACQTHDG